MDAETLKASAAHDEPPSGLAGPLLALWHAHKGNWHEAHKIVQDDESATAAWVHAHLHRVEGDESNANYWYRRAGKTNPACAYDEEWESIIRILVGDESQQVKSTD